MLYAQVVEGFEETVKVVENTPTSRPGDRPLEAAIISRCGVLPPPNGPYEIDA
jgi:hypothetical protein